MNYMFIIEVVQFRGVELDCILLRVSNVLLKPFINK